MSTDRELLELAAKAAGMNFRDDYKEGFGLYAVALGQDGYMGWRYWNPLADDGDALRLAVKLEMMIETALGGWYQAIRMDSNPFECEASEHAGDPMAATRRAIVLCAAEIGRRMP